MTTPRRKCWCGRTFTNPDEVACAEHDGHHTVAVLDTGAFCRVCGIHRVMSTGGQCPPCADDAKREAS